MYTDVINEVGPVSTMIESDGFKIHNVMMSHKDLIQAAIFTSDTLASDLMDQPHINAVMVTINSIDGFIVCSPCMYNSEFVRCVQRNGNHKKMIAESMGYPEINSYIKTDDTVITYVLSKGYMVDNFELSLGIFDFSTNDDSCTIVIEAHDFENITVQNPQIGR